MIGSLHFPNLSTLFLCSGCESETDTEEFEQVGQLERRQVSTSTTDMSQPTTASMCTSTIAISTRSVETITEVRSHISHIEHSVVKRPLSYYAIQGPSKNPPKKPPRLPITAQKSHSDSLPPIPEIQSPDANPTNQMHPKKSIYQSSDTSSSDDVSSITGHHNTGPYVYPHPTDACPSDGEFIHSEFYIDESLPSSVNSADTQDDEKVIGFEHCVDGLRPGVCIEPLNGQCDATTNGAVIHLLQVSHQNFPFSNFF